MPQRRIDFRPTVIEARIYDKGGYKERTKYLGSFVLHVVGEAAELTLLTGVGGKDKRSWDSELDAEMFEYVQSLEVAKLTYEVKGKKVTRNVPAARHRQPDPAAAGAGQGLERVWLPVPLRKPPPDGDQQAPHLLFM